MGRKGEKKNVVQRAVKYFNEKGYSHRNVSSVKAKLESILRRYSEAYAKKNSTGFGDSDHISREGNLYFINVIRNFQFIITNFYASYYM